jgi:hypothetical protein
VQVAELVVADNAPAILARRHSATVHDQVMVLAGVSHQSRKRPVLTNGSAETAAFLYFLPGPQGHGSLRPSVGSVRMMGCARGRQATSALPDPPGVQRFDPGRDRTRGLIAGWRPLLPVPHRLYTASPLRCSRPSITFA